MTFRRLSRAEAYAEALAEYRAQVRADHECDRLLREFFETDEARSAAALEETRPLLAGMSSAQLLDVLHARYRREECLLPCDDHDVFLAVLDEIERRRDATAHERIRLCNLDRNS